MKTDEGGYETAILRYKEAYRRVKGDHRADRLSVYRIEGTDLIRVSQGDGIVASRCTLEELDAATDLYLTDPR